MQGTHTRLEDCRDTNRGAQSLRKQYLIVFGAKAGHHDAKDVQDAANQKQPPRTIVIVYDANERALKRSQHLRFGGRDHGVHQAHHEKDLQ